MINILSGTLIGRQRVGLSMMKKMVKKQTKKKHEVDEYIRVTEYPCDQ